jgi:HTH-type transcriptional regulator, transcriptional repressor of NAD biosynthesis genes
MNRTYKKALVFGKFMPIHKGHLALIEFAKSQSETLVVSMSYTPNDPINPQLRQSWLKQLFDNQADIELAFELDDFNDDGLSLFEATKLWANFIRKRFPDIDAFFCSEDYGAPLSFHLGLPCIEFDKARINLPISATKIRCSPLKYWDFIPEIVQPYFVKKICIYGPESTGKSTLTRDLAKHFNTVFAHEIARDLLTDNDIKINDILRIGRAQTALIKEKNLIANKLLFCDTDLITTQIYSNIYLKTIPSELIDLELETHYDLYFLLDIDVPWIEDKLRDFGDKRAEMYAVFKGELIKRGINYMPISGNWEERKKVVINAINQHYFQSENL